LAPELHDLLPDEAVEDAAWTLNAPTGESECVLQEPTQIGLKGQVNHPGFYELKRMWVEHLQGVTHVDPPGIGFEVRGMPEVVRRRLA